MDGLSCEGGARFQFRVVSHSIAIHVKLTQKMTRSLSLQTSSGEQSACRSRRGLWSIWATKRCLMALTRNWNFSTLALERWRWTMSGVCIKLGLRTKDGIDRTYYCLSGLLDPSMMRLIAQPIKASRLLKFHLVCSFEHWGNACDSCRGNKLIHCAQSLSHSVCCDC